ncbi:MAG: Gfo/Idh/MocA family oxidoreductase [Candidatus Eremiobacteraeota bacterium]|nr:Gfo/Idh/MocA family oxidoreductase [Candidatus Eremiobacteraeota bacterium]
MRILHLLTQKPDYTGSGFYLRALLKEAGEQGHEVAAVVGLGPDDQPDLPHLFPVRFETPELPFPVVGMSDVMPYRSTVWSDLSQSQLQQYRDAFEIVVKRAVQSFQPDLLHCHHLWVLTALVRELYPDQPVVASCHGTGLRQQAKLPHLKSEITPSLERLQHVFFLTQSQQQSTGLDAPSSVVGAGFSPTLFHSRQVPSNTKPRLLFAGKLSYSKGCRELLRAVEPIGAQVSLELAGAGHGAEGDFIAEEARRQDARLLGSLRQAELADVMRASDVFVLPSYYEGLPLVLAEALACGCRIVVNKLPGLEDWLWPELVSSGWVRLVDMPTLIETDQPSPAELHEYVERLRRALLEQAQNSEPPPSCLDKFLRAKSWSGVYREIARHYPQRTADIQLTNTIPTAVLCGAGNRGLEGYGRYALSHPERLRIVAAAEPISHRRELARKRHDLKQVFEDWRELDRPGEPVTDIAIVATPDRQHVEPAIALLRRGYHVLLEKPMALCEADCRRLVRTAEESNRILTVCHVLRYSPYFRAIKDFLASGKLGQVVTVRHLEPVNFWRFMHSFVRGNWSRSSESAPFILSKCCHDFDLLRYLVGRPCRRLSSFGSLIHFRPENRPPQATSRCLQCPLRDEGCPYSATRYYLSELRRGNHDWPVNVLIDDFREEALLEALETGPYGKCVYLGGNDVVDHQVVSLEFEGGVTATFTAAAFTDHRVRETEILGTLGSLRGDGLHLEFSDFESRSVTRWEVPSKGRHLGGDIAMMDSFLKAVAHNDSSLLDTGPIESLDSHLMAFAAEESRVSGRIVVVPGSSQ